MNNMHRTVRLLALAALAALSFRAEAATLTYNQTSGFFFNNPGAWDLGFAPGPGDTARYTNAPGGNYLTYFATTNHIVDKIVAMTASGFGRCRLYSNPQFGASLLVNSRVDIYTDGTTTNDIAGMTWEYFNLIDVTNSTGTAVVERRKSSRFAR